MRRALPTFRREGLNARPAIARDPLDAMRPSLRWLPTPQGMEYSREVVHAYVGLAWYWWARVAVNLLRARGWGWGTGGGGWGLALATGGWGLGAGGWG